jgi:hypothetical protein
MQPNIFATRMRGVNVNCLDFIIRGISINLMSGCALLDLRRA